MKIKFNIKLMKWIVTIGILLLNFTLIGSDDKVFLIAVGVSVNLLGISIFILLSIYPKRYYLVDKDGISYQKSNGEEIWYLAQKDIVETNYSGLGIIPLEAEFIIQDKAERKPKVLYISYEQFLEVKNFLNLK